MLLIIQRTFTVQRVPQWLAVLQFQSAYHQKVILSMQRLMFRPVIFHWFHKITTSVQMRALDKQIWLHHLKCQRNIIEAVHLEVKPAHKTYINSLYYVTSWILKQVLEITSFSCQTFLTPSEQIMKDWWKYLETIDTACLMIQVHSLHMDCLCVSHL